MEFVLIIAVLVIALIALSSQKEEINNAIDEEALEKNALKEYKDFFDSLFEYPLTLDQRKSIVCDADRLLSVASAGSGKTSTLIGKFAYLVESKKAKPEEILILAFNSSVKRELEKRLKDLYFKDFNVENFHTYGRKVLKSHGIPFQIDKIAEGTGDKFLSTDQVRNLIRKATLKKADLQAKIAEFSALTQFHLIETFAKTIDEYNEAISSYPYLRNKFKFNDEFRPLKIPALDGKTWVRSQQELFIANLLIINGINFNYESPFPISENESISPDFYYPEIDTWHEHYAIDDSGFSPFGEDYIRGLEFKENHYREKSIEFFSTNLTDYAKGTLEEKIFFELEKRGVTRNPLPLEEIEQKIRMIYTDSTYDLISDLIGLHKENMSTLEETNLKIDKLEDQTRAQKFKEIFFPIYNAYQDTLIENKTIDFSDMVIKAAEVLKNKNQEYLNVNKEQKFKYVLVDEFQDTSLSREVLVKTILSLESSSKLYCVGDDWQSIYRFTGSDISIMTNFEKRFKYDKRVFNDEPENTFEIVKPRIEVKNISETHRFPESIVSLSSKFIEKNPLQIKKKIKTEKEGGKVFLCKLEKYRTSDIKKILRTIEDKKSVFILTRKKNDIKEIDFKELSDYRPDLKIEYSTIHRVKGSERDVVIVLGLDGGMFGFPRLFSEDPLISMFLPKEDGFKFSEERRVLYVALTRAKESIYLVSAPGKDEVFYQNPSIFFEEIKDICLDHFAFNEEVFEELDFTESIPCEVCASKKINQKMRIKTVRKNKRNLESGAFPGVFMGCSGFSKNTKSPTFCNHTKSPAVCINCFSIDKTNFSQLEIISLVEDAEKKLFVFCKKCGFKKDYYYYQKKENS